MGGQGSGDWWHSDKKLTVEESLGISIGALRGRLFDGAAGSISWTWPSGDSSTVGYFVTDDGGRLTVTFHYRWQDREQVRVPIRLQTTPTQFGCRRRWFTCPLFVNGVACRRRVGNIYLPGGAKYFGCRMCHDLTYKSSQESHQLERILGYSTARVLTTEMRRERIS